eukprot:GILJ01007075.1.p1 GENE.GILJ01007075.1~~GILJ01007075.1.p1  ORF type:complete len:652 (-),score=78.69 GILJ01007075.1:1209-3164(-)
MNGTQKSVPVKADHAIQTLLDAEARKSTGSFAHSQSRPLTPRSKSKSPTVDARSSPRTSPRASPKGWRVPLPSNMTDKRRAPSCPDFVSAPAAKKAYPKVLGQPGSGDGRRASRSDRNPYEPVGHVRAARLPSNLVAPPKVNVSVRYSSPSFPTVAMEELYGLYSPREREREKEFIPSLLHPRDRKDVDGSRYLSRSAPQVEPNRWLLPDEDEAGPYTFIKAYRNPPFFSSNSKKDASCQTTQDVSTQTTESSPRKGLPPRSSELTRQLDHTPKFALTNEGPAVLSVQRSPMKRTQHRRSASWDPPHNTADAVTSMDGDIFDMQGTGQESAAAKRAKEEELKAQVDKSHQDWYHGVRKILPASLRNLIQQQQPSSFSAPVSQHPSPPKVISDEDARMSLESLEEMERQLEQKHFYLLSQGLPISPGSTFSYGAGSGASSHGHGKESSSKPIPMPGSKRDQLYSHPGSVDSIHGHFNNFSPRTLNVNDELEDEPRGGRTAHGYNPIDRKVVAPDPMQMLAGGGPGMLLSNNRLVDSGRTSTEDEEDELDLHRYRLGSSPGIAFDSRPPNAPHLPHLNLTGLRLSMESDMKWSPNRSSVQLSHDSDRSAFSRTPLSQTINGNPSSSSSFSNTHSHNQPHAHSWNHNNGFLLNK